jgi:hypothetical protein
LRGFRDIGLDDSGFLLETYLLDAKSLPVDGRENDNRTNNNSPEDDCNHACHYAADLVRFGVVHRTVTSGQRVRILDAVPNRGN